MGNPTCDLFGRGGVGAAKALPSMGGTGVPPVRGCLGAARAVFRDPLGVFRDPLGVFRDPLGRVWH